jgi:biotin synthase
MSNKTFQILNDSDFSKENLIYLLQSKGEERNFLLREGARIKKQYVDKITYFRGLVEISNLCSKDCLYCGIRSSNKLVKRYNIEDEEIIESVKFAHKNKYASIVLQSGELSSQKYTDRIANLIHKINAETNNELGITLSLGEQSKETYKLWRDAGAKRYLLRIESSNPELYKLLHPENDKHSYDKRLQCLKDLKAIGYQTGTGVMIGLPFQKIDDLANDLLFLKEFDIDMCGMGPYIEHKDTPLYRFKDELLPKEDRYELTLKMIAILRIMMKDINIAATTAMQSIDKLGREKAIMIGANVIMPNVTPGKYRDDYNLYENKPCTDEEAEDCVSCLEARIALAGDRIGLGEHGDSKHYIMKGQS